MKFTYISVIIFSVLELLLFSAEAGSLRTPDEIYGPLFRAVEMGRVFPDSKSFVDLVPREDPKEIVALYKAQSSLPDFNLKLFVSQHFELPGTKTIPYVSDRKEDVRKHIDQLWDHLTREPAKTSLNAYSSLLPLHYPYVVPGGRFREIYYWDSYFTMEGLIASGREDLAASLVRNLADLVLRYGHVPNGNRTYYLSRSQPPFLAAMVELLVSVNGNSEYHTYLPALETEYAFWMEGSEGLKPGERKRNVVMMPDGSILNRYWDERETPRQESYLEDVTTARGSSRPHAEVYANLRAGAESGWDFSSRWLKDPHDLSTIRTMDVIPIDLNSILYQLEKTLETSYAMDGNFAKSQLLHERANSRLKAVNSFLWDEEDGYYVDYLLDDARQSRQLTAATVYPLYFRLATLQQAEKVAAAVKNKLLKRNGLATSLVETGQQWDAPNAWAPLQWLGAEGLGNYGFKKLAGEIASRWSHSVITYYKISGKLVEKYNVNSIHERTASGEYPTQDGFGWTNGVLRAFLARYPAILAL